MNSSAPKKLRAFAGVTAGNSTRILSVARLALGLLSGWLVPPRVDAADAGKPNIVFILMDDLGWADLSCYGSRFYKTPNLDRLAVQGMRFTHAYAACHVCSPTRASILTGKHPARLHLTDWLPGRANRPDQKLARPAIRQQLPLEEVTLAEALRPLGYVTASIGKWHLGGQGFGPEQQEFDLNVAGDQSGSPASYFFPYRREGRAVRGLEEGQPGEYLTDRLTAEAEKFIERNREKPFFLYLAHFAVHIPLAARPELVAKYKNDGKPGTQTNALYAAMIESMDESVGRILKKLDDLQLTERTILVFTSDNGGLATSEGPNTPATINTPLREGKGYLYEGGIRVPLIIRWPGVVKAGVVSSTPVMSMDFFPTLLEAAGETLLSDRTLDGVSLMPLLRQTGEPKREALYWHYPHYSNQGGKPGGAVRIGEFKLIEFYENGRLELFDLTNDPSESRNLAGDVPQKALALQQKLDAWRRAAGAQMMLPNPDYRPSQQLEDGSVVLHARRAEVYGSQLRYEPLPHKNTLGFWTRTEDWVSWDFEISQPGRFAVEMLQGCGNGSGGSEVEFVVEGQILKAIVQETGSFQNFVERNIGAFFFEKPGRYTLTVKPRTKPGPAVMDLRQVALKPVRD